MKYWLFIASILTYLYSCNGNNKGVIDKQLDSVVKANNKLEIIEGVGLDTLSKYSYILFLPSRPTTPTIGTGFFIRKNKRLFLISNYHIFASQNTMEKQSNKRQCDSMYFFFKTKEGRDSTYYIDLKSIRKNSKPIFFDEYPDIYVYELTGLIPETAIINSIEHLLVAIPTKGNIPDDVFAIGFPKAVSKELHFSLINTIYDTTRIKYGPNKKELVFTHSYILSNKSEPGMSGSPIFYKYSDRNKSWICFGGVISSSFVGEGMALAVKPNEVIRRIDKKIKTTSYPLNE